MDTTNRFEIGPPPNRRYNAAMPDPDRRSDSRRNPPLRQRHSGLVSEHNQRTRVNKVGKLVGQLISRRGYASVMSDQQLAVSIRIAVGASLEESFRVGKLRSGVLQVLVVDSVSLQEFNFQRRAILKQLQTDLPDQVTDLRFRIVPKT